MRQLRLPTFLKRSQSKDGLLTRLTARSFARPRFVLFVWLTVLVFGIFAYTTLLRREGFPSVTIPVAVINGVYAVDDPARVDAELAKPIADIALRQPNVKSVQSQSAGNFTTITVQYTAGTDSKAATEALEQSVVKEGGITKNAQLSYSVPYFGATGPSTKKIDATISVYSKNTELDTAVLQQKAQALSAYLQKNRPELVADFFVQDPYQTAPNPLTGESITLQRNFDRYGERVGGEATYYNAAIIGVSAVDNVDVIELDSQLHKVLQNVSEQTEFSDLTTIISASFAPAIEENLSELQRVLLEGLLAVLVIGSLVIAVRASLITVISMVTVIAATLGLLFILGYTLNVITLFALILGLSLIVDDTIIMVEAIDAARRKTKSRKAAVTNAARKISKAMVAATLTAALSFLPLAFVGGVLGTFIRAIPVTIISALIISLFVALFFIPLFSRVILLTNAQMKPKKRAGRALRLEVKIAHVLTWPMQWARHSMRRLWVVGVTAVVIGLLFIGGAGLLFVKGVTVNLFPSSKDSNGLMVTLKMPEGTTLPQSERIVDTANEVMANQLGPVFENATYYGLANAQTATAMVALQPYSEREAIAANLGASVQRAVEQALPMVIVEVNQVDTGPPLSPFIIQIKDENRQAAYMLAADIVQYLETATLKRPDGSTARFVDPVAATPAVVSRSGASQVVTVTADFDGTDTTTLVTLAQASIRSAFDQDRVASYGLNSNALGFDLGQEADNQESFKGLVIAFPVVLLVIFILLAFEFRSLLQPLLIFLAIPFSLFGVAVALYLTNNAFSFFVAMGFFALIGLSIKNTILVIDYANQARKQGMGPIDAARAALEERFRPLIATSLTAVVSLIPLALISPFWQGLAVILIGGLLSSTILVITVFPYYYLGGEYLRLVGKRLVTRLKS